MGCEQWDGRLLQRELHAGCWEGLVQSLGQRIKVGHVWVGKKNGRISRYRLGKAKRLEWTEQAAWGARIWGLGVQSKRPSPLNETHWAQDDLEHSERDPEAGQGMGTWSGGWASCLFTHAGWMKAGRTATVVIQAGGCSGLNGWCQGNRRGRQGREKAECW